MEPELILRTNMPNTLQWRRNVKAFQSPGGWSSGVPNEGILYPCGIYLLNIYSSFIKCIFRGWPGIKNKKKLKITFTCCKFKEIIKLWKEIFSLNIFLGHGKAPRAALPKPPGSVLLHDKCENELQEAENFFSSNPSPLPYSPYQNYVLN